ncbi:MAG: TonB-dependent receptor [Alteromonadales bacterium]|nr:TonB-dependent receptor [Alteromonadales bacterium]
MSDKKFYKKRLNLAISTALLTMLSATTFAEETAEKDIEVIEVKGIRGSMVKAMDIKRTASGVVDAIAAEDIGKFPDQNLAESMQRVSGVSIDRSGGEGQKITVRGFGPEFNNVLVNGRKIASDSGGRDFNFDIIAAELVSGVDIYKTSKAELQSGGIGSTVNIQTAEPFAIGEFKAVGSVKAQYDDNSGETSPQFSGLISDVSDDGNFGVLASFSHQQTQGRSDEAQVDNWVANSGLSADEIIGSPTENTFFPQNYDHRVVFDERTRTGGTLVLQYKPTSNLEITADALYSEFEVETSSSSMGLWFNAGDIENIQLDENGSVIAFDETVNGATDFHSRTFDRKSDLTAFGIAAEWQVSDNLALNFDVSTSTSNQSDPNGNANTMSNVGYWNKVSWDHTQGNQLPSLGDFDQPSTIPTSPDGKEYGGGEGYVSGHYLDPSNVMSNVMLQNGSDIEDEISQIKMDGQYTLDVGPLTNLSFGVLASSQTKEVKNFDNGPSACGPSDVMCYNQNLNVPEEYFTTFDAGSGFLSGLSGTVPTQWLQHDPAKMFAFLNQQISQGGPTWDPDSDFTYDNSSPVSAYTIEEDVIEIYASLDLEGEFGDMPWSANVGVRYAQTDVSVAGQQDTLTSLTFQDPTAFTANYGATAIISENSDYDNLMPNVNFNLELTENLLARFAYSQSITRPTLSQISPAEVIGSTRPGGILTSSAGNSALKPFESDNIDLSLEWYYDEGSYLSGGYFQKDVANFIVTSFRPTTYAGVTDPSTGDDSTDADSNDEIAQFTLSYPTNGRDTTVDGFEIAVQHAFGESGFGVMANMTVVNSDAELDVNDLEQSFALTGLSDSQNFIVYYEKYGIQLRLAYNQRDGFLQSLDQPSGGSEPTFVEEYHQFDFSGSYDFNEHVTVFFEGTNITGEETLKHGRYANHFLSAQDTGARYSFGVRGSF